MSSSSVAGKSADLIEKPKGALPDGVVAGYCECMDLVRRRQGFRPPLEHERETHLIVQCSADADVNEPPATAVEEVDVEAPTDTARREQIWAYRGLLNESIRAEGILRRFDPALPLKAIPHFDREVRDSVERLAPDARVVMYGHIGDGNCS